MALDGLTRIHDKRAFEGALDREVSRAHENRRPLSLVLFDIDHFRRISDEIGHFAGDAVLRQLASFVRANARPGDVAARVGGEEFALLVPGLTGPEAWITAEHLRALVARTPCRFEDLAIPITASFGVAQLVAEPPMEAKALFRAADERLSVAKRRGRNRVE
jgi:diguanylate cyclase